MSIVDDPKAESLRELLRLYDMMDSEETRNQIEGKDFFDAAAIGIYGERDALVDKHEVGPRPPFLEFIGLEPAKTFYE